MRSYRYLILGLALFFCLYSVVAAARLPLADRQDGNPSERSQTPTATGEGSAQPSSTAPARESSIATTESNRPPTTREAVTSSSLSMPSSTIAQALATATSSASSASSSAGADSKDPLPIHPQITPALGLAGAIMLISGTVYAVIGIKNKWLYVFFSAAYLTSLAVSVLIIYLMTPPVSNAVQGAFFVAAFLSGLILGALALVFADLTEGLGCLLGGFCLGMWFLTLKEGGLITSTAGRAIFIGCFSAGGYALSFSHYTRTYGLMACISFAGASITMLGIDCFSRAGWKEFWLYLWNLNPDTFPLFTNTYPITRGIKVELAGVVILCIFGIISQLRLWRLVKERREKSASQRLERQRDQEREEEELGRRIQDDFQRERAQWEATYGDKGFQEPTVDSCVTTPKTSTSVREKNDYSPGSVEMAPLPRGKLARSASKQDAVVVAVLQEDEIQHIDEDGSPMTPKGTAPATHLSASISRSNSTRPSVDTASRSGVSRSVSVRSSLQPATSPPPAVVPLPFRVPEEQDPHSPDADNISVSAVPDTTEGHLSDRRSLSKRLSEMSAFKRFSNGRMSPNHSESEEALMIPHVEDDRASSVAATLDDADDVSLAQLSPPHSPLEPKDDSGAMQPSTTNGHETSQSPTQTQAIADSTIQSPLPEAVVRQSLTISTDPKPGESRSKRMPSQTRRMRSDTVVSVVKDENGKSQQSRSTRSDAPSPSSQTEQCESAVDSFQEALPSKLSKVAMSYRTNEWAKHLEAAETPELEELLVPVSPGVQVSHASEERPAPVNEEITQPLVVAKRNSNRVSSSSTTYGNSGFVRSTSNNSRNSLEPQPLSRTPSGIAAGGESRSASQVQDRGARISSTQLLPVAEPVDERSPSALSPLPGNTLLDQRETRVRNRVSSQSFNPHSASATSPATTGDTDNIPLTQRKRLLQNPRPPSASQKWRESNLVVGSQMQGFNSHQPKRAHASGSDQKREVLLAGWRESIRQDGAPVQTTAVGEGTRRTAMMNVKRNKDVEKEQQAMAAQQRESMMINMMRSNEMLDAHREAMRRMQANANKKL